MARAMALALLLLAPHGLLLADWTASGVFQYQDREYDQSGFTGSVGLRPVRFADLEIVDANASAAKQVIARGSTNAAGVFSVFVQDSKVRSVYARVVTRSDETPDLNVEVVDRAGSQGDHYAAASATTTLHDPGVNLNFGTSTILIGQGGEPFNVYDQVVKGADYAAYLNGARPSVNLPVIWGLTNGVAGSWYDPAGGRINLRDTAGYDDTVVLHEMGHFINRLYSDTDSTNDAHTFAWCDIDLRLAFDEGWATFFGNSALRHRGEAASNIYTRTNGGPGAGNLVRSADLEADAQYLCSGATSEVSVFSVLWDIVDGPGTTDTTPGEDDAHDLLDLDDLELWEVFTDHLPTATDITLEDFWDGWFLPPIQNGFHAEMTDIAEHVGIEYSEDPMEVNDLVSTPTVYVPGTPPVHATFFRDPDMDGAGAPDDDFYAFDALSGETYIIETLALLSGGNTKMYLIDSDATTVLAINDDRSAGDESSFFQWTAPASGTYFARVFHSTDEGVYGSYDFRVSPLNSVDNDLDGYVEALDCDDTNPFVNPGIAEVCNLSDDNCNLLVDEGFDQDLDGFSTCAGDCDDSRPGVHPNASEVLANGLDDNCNGLIDEQSRGVGRKFSRDFPRRAPE